MLTCPWFAEEVVGMAKGKAAPVAVGEEIQSEGSQRLAKPMTAKRKQSERTTTMEPFAGRSVFVWLR